LLKRARAPVAELNKPLEHLKTKARVAWAFVLKRAGRNCSIPLAPRLHAMALTKIRAGLGLKEMPHGLTAPQGKCSHLAWKGLSSVFNFFRNFARENPRKMGTQ